MLHDPFLNYFALGLLFFVVAVLFYGMILLRMRSWQNYVFLEGH